MSVRATWNLDLLMEYKLHEDKITATAIVR